MRDTLELPTPELPTPGERQAAAALQLGQPRLTLALSADPQLRAAALLRLGDPARALHELAQAPADARTAVLHARALGTLEAAQSARAQARQEGDGPALVAAAVLLGERLLASDPRAALHALAEGLKVCELSQVEADAHLLAVLAQVQARVGSAGKAKKTAQKALDRSAPGSPARVVALLALGQREEAQAEALRAELWSGFWSAFE